MARLSIIQKYISYRTISQINIKNTIKENKHFFYKFPESFRTDSRARARKTKQNKTKQNKTYGKNNPRQNKTWEK